MLLIRAADLRQDARWIHQLWNGALDERWRLSRGALRRQLASTLCLVAELDGAPVGFCAGTYDTSGPAAVIALLVNSAYRRQGFGSQLLASLEANLRALGAQTLRLGCGADSTYFWPGVPISHPPVWNFFASRGWRAEEPVFDLVADLKAVPSHGALEYASTDNSYRFAMATAGTRRQIEDFEAEHFPVWTDAFRSKLIENRFHEVLVAYAGDASVAGSVLLEDSLSLAWSKSLGPGCAGLSALGVAASHRRRGLGQALTLHAFSLARERGFVKCYVNWTGLVAWYGKLGAKPWAEYTTGEKQYRTAVLRQRNQPLS